MKSWSTLSVLFLLAIAYSSNAIPRKSECSCGYLGPGTNPCSCSDVVVRAQKLTKPHMFAPPQAISDAATARAISARYEQTHHKSSSSASDAFDTGFFVSDGSSSGCGCNKKGAEEIRGLLNTNPNGQVAPSFAPIGDLCYPLPVDPRTGKIVEVTTKVTPAYPGKIPCECPVPYTCEDVLRQLQAHTASSGSSNSLRQSAASRSLILGGQSGILGGGVILKPPVINLGIGGISGSGPKFFGGAGSSSSASSSSSSFGSYKSSSSASSASSSSAASRSHSKFISSSPRCFDDEEDTISDYTVPEAPADAVSLTLAYKNLQAPNVIYKQGKKFVPEDKLSFGHRTIPTEVKTEKKQSDIPEEKLLTVDKPVVELKVAPPKTIVVGSYDDQEEANLAELEAIERESINQEEQSEQVAENFVSYRDLGYAPVGASVAGPVVGRNNAIVEDNSEAGCGPLGPTVPGYVAGSVVVQSDVIEPETPRESEALQEQTYIEEDIDSGEDDDEGGIIGRLRTIAKKHGSPLCG